MKILQKLAIPTTILLLTITACSRDRKVEIPVEKGEQTTAQETKGQPPPAPEYLEVQGNVLEVLSGGNFIFILVDRGGEKSWVTMPAADVKVGENVTLINATLFGKFYSKSLDRTFDSLIFASGIVGKPPQRMFRSNSPDPGQGRSARLSGEKTPVTTGSGK